MKVTLSIPNRLFEAGERLRRDLKMSKSALYAIALDEFVAKYEASITERLNAVYGQNGSGLDDVMQRFQARTINQNEW